MKNFGNCKRFISAIRKNASIAITLGITIDVLSQIKEMNQSLKQSVKDVTAMKADIARLHNDIKVLKYT
jgi:hypothetical protein